MNTAEIILQQLGGSGRLGAMVGANNFATSGPDLQFRIKGSRKINHIKIELNSMDLYDITFSKLGRVDFKTVSQLDSIYAEDMKRLIESETGLYLSM